ncbi:hypothetical protein EKO23_15960 [Nocardioides guangzhouensis]|uniref:Uncharacterized protein n=1 Tax=Nocardioides guangzhouensis TaxID=2497878 RepID=A0A4Q4Z926_9ACTN|nr:hypothetical protein [Nocardioides guangzhouensis]RYP84333.1 hypothetical protein EKO23_15960 [Nocardioides guangzhouensis]
MGAAERALETESQQVLARLLGGRVEPRDVPPAQGQRDFDLVDDQGSVLTAVEVTSVQLPLARATRAQMERIRHQDVGLQTSWMVAIHEEADLAASLAQVVSLLNKLESHGISAFGAPFEAVTGRAVDAVDELRRLRIAQGRAMPDSVPPRLFPSGYGSGSIDPANLTAAVEAEIEKPDNRRKLGEAPTGAERHMFVWLHDSHWYVSSLLRDGWGLPPAPALPSEVDVVWIGVADGNPQTCSALLRVDSNGIQAIDPMTGSPRTMSTNSPATGPPEAAPHCPVCGTPGVWMRTDRTRHDPSTGHSTAIQAWEARCPADTHHWWMPGRPLTKREL